jgi:hypothetical protein
MVKSPSRQSGDPAAHQPDTDAVSGLPAAAMAGTAPESFEPCPAVPAIAARRRRVVVEQSLADYRRGVALIGRCRKPLANVQQQVRIRGRPAGPEYWRRALINDTAVRRRRRHCSSTGSPVMASAPIARSVAAGFGASGAAA